MLHCFQISGPSLFDSSADTFGAPAPTHAHSLSMQASLTAPPPLAPTAFGKIISVPRIFCAEGGDYMILDVRHCHSHSAKHLFSRLSSRPAATSFSRPLRHSSPSAVTPISPPSQPPQLFTPWGADTRHAGHSQVRVVLELAGARPPAARHPFSQPPLCTPRCAQTSPSR